MIKFDMEKDIDYKYYNIINTPNKNIVACAIFKMENNYRDFSAYSLILYNVAMAYITSLKKYNFIFRIYYDVNCRTEIHNTFKLKDGTYTPNVELVEYNCKIFKSTTDDNYHIGTFGTFVRFMPYYLDEFNYVFVTDVNHSKHQLYFMINHILESMRHKFEVSYIYINSYRYTAPKDLSISKINNVLLANIFTNVKLPISNINKFMSKICNNTYTSMINALIEKNNTKTSTIASPFVYGFDEYYINKFFFKYHLKHVKNIYFLIVRDNRISTTFKYLMGFMKKGSPELPDIYIDKAKSDEDYDKNCKIYKNIRKNILKNYTGSKKSGYYKSLLLLETYGYNIFDSVSSYKPFVYVTFEYLKKIMYK